MLSKEAMSAFADEVEKIALVERLVRLGATDVGGPRMVMRKRSPQELRALQEGVEAAWSKRVTKPILHKAVPAIEKIPENVVTKYPKKYLSWGLKQVAQDPVGIGAMQFLPGTGATTSYILAKKGLEKAIDKAFPLPVAKSVS